MNEAGKSQSVTESARAFDAELHTTEYALTHADAVQLDRLIGLLEPDRYRCYLDLGTGAGYVCNQLAEQFQTSQVFGADIAENALHENARIARRKRYFNLHFVKIDGINLPFADRSFAGVISRYAFHHFPNPTVSLAEIARVLDKSGQFVLSDAVRHAADDFDFINTFQDLKKDGHIEMLGTDPLKALLQQQGYTIVHTFESSLSFDRASTPEYEKLIDSTPEAVLDAYQLSIMGSQIHLTFPIFNAVLRPLDH